MRNIFSNFVCFSESPNFKSKNFYIPLDLKASSSIAKSWPKNVLKSGTCKPISWHFCKNLSLSSNSSMTSRLLIAKSEKGRLSSTARACILIFALISSTAKWIWLTGRKKSTSSSSQSCTKASSYGIWFESVTNLVTYFENLLELTECFLSLSATITRWPTCPMVRAKCKAFVKGAPVISIVFFSNCPNFFLSSKKSFLMSLFLMSQKVAHNNEQGIEESSKKIIQMIAFNWQHSILKLFDNFFKLNSDSFKFCAWVLNSAKNEEFDRGSRIDLQSK